MRVLYLGGAYLPQPKARAIQIVHTCRALHGRRRGDAHRWTARAPRAGGGVARLRPWIRIAGCT